MSDRELHKSAMKQVVMLACNVNGDLESAWVRKDNKGGRGGG